MGGFLRRALPVAAVAAAPFTGGASLAGGLGSLGSTIGTIGQVLSAVSTAQSLFGGPREERQQAPVQQQEVGPAEPPPFTPERPGEAALPESLNELAAFSPEQQRSALATRGLNVGLGSEEDAYYRNLLQRALIGEGGKVNTENPDFLLPVESQFFSRRGQNTSDIMEFLKGIRG